MNFLRALAWIASCTVGTIARAAQASPPAAPVEQNADSQTKACPDEPCTDSVPPLAWVAVAVPGVVLHGSGHFVAGRKETALRLALMETSGVGLILIGGVPIVLTGASRYIVGPAALAVIGGFGLFGMSFLSDIYGLAAPRGGTGAPLRWAPRVESRAGYMYVYDPQFPYRHFVVLGADARLGPVRLSPMGWFGADDLNERLRFEAAYRLGGPRPDRRALDGSFWDVQAAVTRHVFPRFGFATNTFELALNGRLDLGRFDRGLRGSFAEMGAGIGVQQIAYDLPGDSTEDDLETLLLARMAYGIYLGGQNENAGEIALYYDHRHDDFAAGLQIPGLGSGVAGHFGLEAEVYDGVWGAGADIQVGSAYVATLTLLYRHPVKR